MPPQYSKLDNLNLITLNSISEHFCIIFGPTRHENHRFAPVLYFMVVCELSLAQLRKLRGIFQSLIVSSFFFHRNISFFSVLFADNDFADKVRPIFPSFKDKTFSLLASALLHEYKYS